MRIGTKFGLSGCALGFLVAAYFAATPIFSALSSGASLSAGSVGVMLGIGFCAVGTFAGMYYSRRGRSNA